MAKAQAQYKIAFNEHPAHENLKRLQQQVAELPDELLDAAREHDSQASLPRLEPVLEFVGALLASADTALVTHAMLEGLDAPIQQISSALTPLRDNKEFEQLATIQAGIEALLNVAVQIAPAIGVWAQTDRKKAAAQLGEAATEKTRQLQQQASDLQGQLNQLQEQIGQASESVKTTAAERLNELQGQLDTLKAETEAEHAKVQGTIDSFGTQFAEKQKELTDKAEQSIQEGRNAAAEALKNDQENAEKTLSDLKGRAKEIIRVLAEKKQEAIDMVDVAATSSTAGGFKKEAEEQKAQADQWRSNAIRFGALAAAVALFAVALAVEGVGSGASLIVAKIAAITLLLGIAGYAAGQSGQHRRREQRARRLYLELVAFKPFSEPLDDPEKNAVRKEFIERLFVGDPGAEGEDHRDGDVKMSDENLSVLLKFIDLIRSNPSSTSSN